MNYYRLLILCAAALWGTSGVTGAALFEMGLGPLSVAFYRLAIGAVALLAGLYVIRNRLERLDTRSRLVILGMGASQALYQLFFFAALPSIGVAAATLLALCVAPVLITVFSVSTGQERLTGRLFLTLGLALLGTYLLSGVGALSQVQDSLRGVAFALGSATSFAGFILLGREVRQLHPLQPSALSFALGALFLLPFVFTNLNLPIGGAWLSVAYLGLLPTALSYALFIWGLRHTRATTASILTLAEPLVATLLAWLWLGESLGSSGILGAGMLISALLLSTFKPAYTRA